MPLTQVQGGMILPSTTLTTPIVATTMGVGGATPANSGSGITFPATQSASTDANTLDDYEEGTWTPRLADASSGGNSNTTNSAGWYTKIGNQVTIYGRLDSMVTTGFTSSNQIWIRDLPFVSANTMGVLPSSMAVSTVTFTGTAPTAYLGNNASSFRLYSQASGGGGAVLLVSAISSGNSWVYFVITYQVA